MLRLVLAIVASIGVMASTAAQSPATTAATIRFTNVAATAGLTLVNVHGSAKKDYILDTNGNGAAWLDYDNDGDLDALLVNGSTREQIRQGGHPMAALYRNEGNGAFTDVTQAAGVAARGWGMGVCVTDYDNDGFRDVYITAFGSNVLYRNDGDGAFSDVTASAGVGDARWSTGCAFGDYDRDGDVDLYVANYVEFDEATIPTAGSLPTCQYGSLPAPCGPRGLQGEADTLYRNDADGTFTDVTQEAGIADPGYYGFGVLFSDLDDDGWPDILVANDSVPNQWFRNQRDGTFVDDALAGGLALSSDGREQAGMGVDAGDYNGDGRLDVVVTNFSDDYNTLYQSHGEGLFTDVTHAAGLGVAARSYLGWGVGLVDVQNDGRLDLFAANGHVYPNVDDSGRGTTYRQQNQLFLNVGNNRFRDVTDAAGDGLLVEHASRGAAFGDYDNDGDVDVLVVNMEERPTLLRNDTRGGGHWITLRLAGGSTPLTTGPARVERAGTRSNRDGIGARVRVSAGGRTHVAEVRSGGSYLSHNDMRVHVGLGSAERVTRVDIRWPSGLVETIEDLEVDRFYVVEEGAGIR